MNEPNIQNAIRLIKVKFPEFNIIATDSFQDNQPEKDSLNMSLTHSALFSATTTLS